MPLAPFPYRRSINPESVPMRFLSAILCALALFTTGCDKLKKEVNIAGPNSSDPKKTNEDPETRLKNGTPDVKVTAEDWFKEFKENESAAKTKYKGKIIEVTGTVHVLAFNDSQKMLFVHLKVKDDILGVRCGTKNLDSWELAHPGAEVTIRGELPDLGFFKGELYPSIAVSAKNTAPTKSTSDLSKELKANAEKFEKDWARKGVLVTGEVSKSPKKKDGFYNFELKGDNGIKIECSASDELKTKLNQLQVGTKVKGYAELTVTPDGLDLNFQAIKPE